MTLLKNEVDEFFAEWDKPNSPGFAVAIIQNNEIIYKRGYGTANLEYGIPISPSSVFDVGSISKQFTAMCIALLAKQRKLSLDDEIQKHITEMPRYKHPIFIRHLIHHTSGIRDYLTLMWLAGMRFENEYPDEEIIDLIARQKNLNFKPGEEFFYSNSGYFLLAEIVKRVSGESLRSFADKNIFIPLKMQSSHFHDDFTMIVKDRAIGYSPKNKEDGFRIDMSLFGIAGTGGVHTTVEDLFLWDRNFSKNILGGGGQALIETVITPGTLNSGETLDYAFGLGTGPYREQKMISHNGAWAGYRAGMLRFPEHSFSVICLSNLGSANPMRLAIKIADLYLASELSERKGEHEQQKRQFVEIPSVDLKTMAGSYFNEKTGIILELSMHEGKLVVEFSGESYLIAPISSNRFIYVQFPEIEIEFKKRNSAVPTQISVSVGNDISDVYQRLDVIALSSDQLKDFVGKYHSEELDVTYKITLENDKLILIRKNFTNETLKQTLKDLLKGAYNTFEFIRDNNSGIIGFNLGVERENNIFFGKEITDDPIKKCN